MKRFGLTAIALALLVTACGVEVSPDLAAPGGEDTLVQPSAPASQTEATTVADPAETAGSTATTTPAAEEPATASEEPATSEQTEPAVAAQLAVAPYFFIDEKGRPNRHGPFLLPVNREVAHTKAVGRAAIEQLLAGPSGRRRASPPSRR